MDRHQPLRQGQVRRFDHAAGGDRKLALAARALVEALAGRTLALRRPQRRPNAEGSTASPEVPYKEKARPAQGETAQASLELTGLGLFPLPEVSFPINFAFLCFSDLLRRQHAGYPLQGRSCWLVLFRGELDGELQPLVSLDHVLLDASSAPEGDAGEEHPTRLTSISGFVHPDECLSIARSNTGADVVILDAHRSRVINSTALSSLPSASCARTIRFSVLIAIHRVSPDA